MKTQEWIPHDDIPPRTATVESSPSTARTEPLVRAVNGIAILAIVFGGLGAGAAGALGHSSTSHAHGHRSAHAIHHAGSAHSAGTIHKSKRPWMP
jgi:hypothetical protein